MWTLSCLFPRESSKKGGVRGQPAFNDFFPSDMIA